MSDLHDEPSETATQEPAPRGRRRSRSDEPPRHVDLRSARELVGLTQIELARRAGLKRGVVFDIEAGRIKSPAHDTVVRLVRALKASGLHGVTSDQLFPVPER